LALAVSLSLAGVALSWSIRQRTQGDPIKTRSEKS
jgi:hypothetical protein